MDTQKYPGQHLLDGVDEHVEKGWKLIHPLDDINLIAGYAPMAYEILDKLDPDIVVVCCGGGSLLAGISAGLSLLGSQCVVYGVEPLTANTMSASFKEGHAIKLPTAKSIASGLAPPMCGTLAYEHCKKYVKDILLVSDDEIKEACKIAFTSGLKAELSGCAALAAILFDKVPEIAQNSSDKKLKVVCILSGGNVSAAELADLF